MIAPLFNNSIHGDVLMRRDWIDTCLKYKPQGEVKNVIDMVRSQFRPKMGREVFKATVTLWLLFTGAHKTIPLPHRPKLQSQSTPPSH